MAEIELRVLRGQCLPQRLAGRQTLERAVEAGLLDRNERCVGVDWQFRTEKARSKFKKLYPLIQA